VQSDLLPRLVAKFQSLQVTPALSCLPADRQLGGSAIYKRRTRGRTNSNNAC